MSIQVLTTGLRVALAALCAAVAVAAPLAAEPTEGWDTKIWSGFELQGESDLDNGPGDFDFWMLVLGASARTFLDERAELVLKGDYRAIGYDFDNVGFEPWDTVHVLRLAPRLQVHLNEAWSVFGGPIFELSGETEADFSDAARGGAAFGGGYRNDDVQVQFGLIVQSEIEDHAYVAPLIRLNWGITDDLRLTLRSESSQGGEARLIYGFLDDFEASLGGGFRRERFRLDDDGAPDPNGRRDGVGEEKAGVADVRFAWDFIDPMRLEAYVGLTIDGEFRLENKRGHRIAERDYDTAPYGGVRLAYRF